MLRPDIAEKSNIGKHQTAYDSSDIEAASRWFAEHVTLFGRPYTLDRDQVCAAIDTHRNTLVTARAGSGKTRVIVAKVAYLVAHQLATLDEILIFMFNRTAAAEVNERLVAVEVDGRKLTDFDGNNSAITGRENTGEASTIHIASTFHKFALDTMKLAGEHPNIISESEHSRLVAALLDEVLSESRLHLSPNDYREMLGIVNNFITRAGQMFPGQKNLGDLANTVANYCERHYDDLNYRRKVRFHEISFAVYARYLAALQPPAIDFNLMMSRATDLLEPRNCPPPLKSKLEPLKYILIDEYQDFSYLFFAIVQAIRRLATDSHLFAVGDDWQAINRFAGSDVNYFIHFADYFPDDTVNIPLATNYRSHRRIVETANRYMLNNYNPDATPAIAKERQKGKIIFVNPNKIKIDQKDLSEDGLGDGRYIQTLEKYRTPSRKTLPVGAAKMLKAVVKIIARHPYEEFMLLHRHNFTSFEGVSLATFVQALAEVLSDMGIMTWENFSRQVRCMTMHKSKGLEAENVILLELDREVVKSEHPHATIFELFGDTRAAEIADQQRLVYVAVTRAKKRLYLLSKDEKPIVE